VLTEKTLVDSGASAADEEDAKVPAAV